VKYEQWDAILPANQRHRPKSPSSSTKGKRKGFLSFDINDPEGWFNRRPPDQQHRLAVEMLRFIPKREQTGKGERQECISVLCSLKNHFGEEEALQICMEADWVSEHWVPARELPTIHDPTNAIGNLIYKARERGWVWEWNETPVAPPPKPVSPTPAAPTLCELFPQPLVAALQTVCRYLPYDDDLIAVAYLAGTAGLMKHGSGLNCNPLSDFLVPANLYVGVVAPTGSKKTTVEKNLIDAPYNVVKASMREDQRAALMQWKQQVDKEEEEPRPPLLTVKNVTGEALEKTLCDQERHRLGLLLKRDELAGLFLGMNQHKGGRGNDEQALLEYYDGSGIETIRLSSSNRICDRTLLSIYGATQPEVLMQLQQGIDDNGKWARFMFVGMAPRPTKLATNATSQERDEHAAAKQYLGQLALAVRKQPAILYSLAPDALKHFAEFEFGKQQEANDANLPSQSAILNKTSGKVGRVACLLHIIQMACEPDFGMIEEVSLTTLEAAIKLVEHCDRWALRFQELSNRSDSEKAMHRLHQIAVKSKSAVPLAVITRGLHRKEREKWNGDFLSRCAKALAAEGYGEVIDGPRGGLRYRALKPLAELEEGWT
jgi:CRISPR-associated protein Cmr3